MILAGDWLDEHIHFVSPPFRFTSHSDHTHQESDIMDFPVCPACHQSVIDDDAVDCPFCGAPMKSKPGAKPAPVAAKPAAPVAKPMPKPGAKPAPSKPTLPGDDFPFEAELTIGKSAIPAMPNPTKQRTLQVICPMCDTKGYVPPNAPGQDVRCSNPKCVMPVFTVPLPKKPDVAPPPPPPKSSNLPFYGGMTVVLMLVIGGGLYVFNMLPSNSGPRQKELSQEEKDMMAEAVGGSKAKKNQTKTDPQKEKVDQNKNQNAAPEAANQMAADELIKLALKQMNESSLERNKQLSKPYCRQLAAEASAVTGNAKAAREHLDQLIKVGGDVSYFRIIPLLDLFWSEFTAGDKKGSAKTLNDAMADAPKIPKFGRTRQEIAGRLAAGLVIGGRSEEATTLLSELHSADAEAQLAARWQMATDGRVARLSDSYSVLRWKFPQPVAATASLIAHGQLEAAGKWAAGQSSDDGKAECLSVWAQEVAFRKAPAGSADAGGAIAQAIALLPPALAARVWARAGCGRFMAGDQPGVLAATKLAQEKLAEVSAPMECKMPTVKLTDRFKLPLSLPLFQAATAAGEIAYLQAQSPTTRSDAEASLDLAMSFVDATAPSFAVAKQRFDEAERLGGPGLRKLMEAELKKKKDDELRIAASNYRRALNEILEAAQQRFDVETQLLSRLRGAGVGLNSKVWIIVNTRTTADDINLQDDFFATGLPGELREGLRGTDEEKAILGAWNLRYPGTELPRPISVQFNELLETDIGAAVEIFKGIETKSTRREELVLQSVSRLAATNKLPIAYQLIGKLDGVFLREDCYLLASAIATQKGQGDAVWKQVAQVMQQTEKVAICRGLIAGLQAAGKPNDEFPEPASK